MVWYHYQGHNGNEWYLGHRLTNIYKFLSTTLSAPPRFYDHRSLSFCFPFLSFSLIRISQTPSLFYPSFLSISSFYQPKPDNMKSPKFQICIINLCNIVSYVHTHRRRSIVAATLLPAAFNFRTPAAFPPRTQRYNYRDFYDMSRFQVQRNLVDILSRRNFFFNVKVNRISISYCGVHSV